MVLAGQYSAQGDANVLDAILGNVGTVICFRLGASDASLFAKYLATPSILPRDLSNLPNYEMVVRLMVRGGKQWGFQERRDIYSSDPYTFDCLLAVLFNF